MCVCDSLQITSFDRPKRKKTHSIFKCLAFQCVANNIKLLKYDKTFWDQYFFHCCCCWCCHLYEWIIVIGIGWQCECVCSNKNNDCFDMMHASKFYSAMCWFSSCRNSNQNELKYIKTLALNVSPESEMTLIAKLESVRVADSVHLGQAKAQWLAFLLAFWVIKFIYYGLNFEWMYRTLADASTMRIAYISVKIVLNKYFDFATINLMIHKLLMWVFMSCTWFLHAPTQPIIRTDFRFQYEWEYSRLPKNFQFHTLKKNFQLERG